MRKLNLLTLSIIALVSMPLASCSKEHKKETKGKKVCSKQKENADIPMGLPSLMDLPTIILSE